MICRETKGLFFFREIKVLFRELSNCHLSSVTNYMQLFAEARSYARHLHLATAASLHVFFPFVVDNNLKGEKNESTNR